ncbi:hypothetical protein [Halorubellus sp. PRR65]|uniref:DUF7344 domain-containing protein n=1 Tax=Halorubellus sp. PRR65 TaxID=3098148 RepID=UPI002B25C928|nr:hypothetical protein [Halorubellus sp. PRR65]
MSDGDDVDTHCLDATEGGAPPVGLDAETYRALGSTVRRRLLEVILDEPREWTRDELAAALVEWDQDVVRVSSTAPHREEILIELHHDHLPRLDDAALLSYDPEDGTVSPEPVDDAVERTIRRTVRSTTED